MSKSTRKKKSKDVHSKNRTSSLDFLGLKDTTKYPTYVKLYNFYIKRYVFLDPHSYIQEIDLYDYKR